MTRSDPQSEAGRLRAALNVCGFTVHYLSLFIDEDARQLTGQQIEAAHDAYREATGEQSWDQMISGRIAERTAMREAEQCSR